MDVDVAVAGVVLDDGDGGGLDDGADQPLPAAGDDQVDKPLGRRQGGHDLALGAVDDGHGRLRQLRRRQARPQALGDGEVRVDGLLAPAEDAGVAALEAQPGRVGGPWSEEQQGGRKRERDSATHVPPPHLPVGHGPPQRFLTIWKNFSSPVSWLPRKSRA